MNDKQWMRILRESLQGLTHWIGRRRCQYRHYPLAEGALVAELCNMVHGKINHPHTLQCEVPYVNFVNRLENPLTNGSRADLVVFEGEMPRFIIEVKRHSAGMTQINADLRRLLAARTNSGAQTYLIVVSEGQRPANFVLENGYAMRGMKNIADTNGHYRVRAAVKAAHSFRAIERAQYACALKVELN